MKSKAVVAAALSEAGIFDFAHERVMNGWEAARKRPLAVQDIEAWESYQAMQNAIHNHRLGVGFLVYMLTQGYKAPFENYQYVVDEEAYILE